MQKYIKLLSNQALYNNAKAPIPIVAQSQNKNRHKADFNFVVGVTGFPRPVHLWCAGTAGHS